MRPVSGGSDGDLENLEAEPTPWNLHQASGTREAGMISHWRRPQPSGPADAMGGELGQSDINVNVRT